MSGTPYPKTCALISSLGIDPGRVRSVDLDTTGYDELLTDDTTGLQLFNDDGTVATMRRPWPSLADGIRVIDQFIQEGGAR